MIVTIGLYSLVALVWGVFVEPGRLAYNAFSEFSLVTLQATARGTQTSLLAKLQSNPEIERIIPATFIRVELPGLVPGQGFQFDLLGLNEDDVTFLQKRFAATVKDGRNPQAGTPEIVLSQDVANMLNVKVGDRYTATNVEFYAGMEAVPEPTTFEVVGILDSEIESGIVSLEYLNQAEQYRNYPSRFLVVAEEGHKEEVDGYLRNEILSMEIDVKTEEMLSERILNEALPGLAMLIPVVLIVGMAFSMVIVVVNQLANAQRLPEFGILHATGRSKRWLGRRLTKESTSLALLGWFLGIIITWVVLHLLKVTVFEDLGHHLDYPIWLPVLFSIPVPAAIAGFTALAVRRTLKRLDAVAIVERRELSQEGDQSKRRRISTSLLKPLAPSTFYKRYSRRAVLLISSMGLMILAVTLFIFTLAVGADAKEPFLGYLSRVSIIKSPGMVQSLDPGIPALVEAHPAVKQVIPIAPRYNMVNVYIPPFNSAEASPFGVYAADMAYLVDLYDLELKEGHLPRPGTNEMVIPETLALNRGLEVGDVIGDPLYPAYPNAPSLETEFVISGIFAKPSRSKDEDGWAFISLEYLEEINIYDIPDVPPMIVVPKEGQKTTLDDWLENELDGFGVSVVTQAQEITRIKNNAKQDMLSIAGIEVGIAIVAATGLAVLNYIFTAQRNSEFAVLNTLGYDRWQLVRRVLGETAFLVGIAWGFSVLFGLGGMLILRFALYAPLGLTFDLFNITPWLYTLPIPIAVMVVTTATTARTLSRLDPVAVIERRE
jgi:ABC-type lipoprotein release transport system permease subunit